MSKVTIEVLLQFLLYLTDVPRRCSRGGQFLGESVIPIIVFLGMVQKMSVIMSPVMYGSPPLLA